MAGRAAPRNVRIEALRVIAIVAIAVFHTFQPLFAQMTGWLSADAATRALAVSAGDGAALMASAPAAASLLGFINLLGAFGNCVFFMISGFFVIPSAVHGAHTAGYGRVQAAKTARRIGTILFSVALYAAAALLVSSCIAPLPGVSLHETGWLLGGLEFIWVYLAIMVVAPLIGWLWARLPRPRALAWTIVIAVYAVNAYIAFVSPGSNTRGLLEWRKLMSAVSYLAAFLAGGALAPRTTEHVSAPNRTRHHHAAWELAAGIGVALALECSLALAGAGRLMEATSFKSTSLLSFVLAALALRAAAQPSSTSDAPGRARAVILEIAASILGFYILQSMFYAPWRAAADAVLNAAIAIGLNLWGAPGTTCVLVLLAGVLVSIAIVAVFIAIDQLVRMPLLRLLHLR